MTTQPKPIDEPTHLAFERTSIAQERTLLAWIRTAIALISFGFTIFSVFALEKGAGHKFVGFWGPRFFSIGLILAGLTSLLLATIQHNRDVRVLRSIDASLRPTSNSMVLAFLIALLGLFAMAFMLVTNL